MDQIAIAMQSKEGALVLSITEWEGVKRIAQVVRDDFAAVTGDKPRYIELNESSEQQPVSLPDGFLILAGTWGKSDIFTLLSDADREKCALVAGRREVYTIFLCKSLYFGDREILMVCGSEKRGTIYGLLHLSELVGVSPWTDWADVPVLHRDVVVIPRESLEMTSREPSVRYRGFFINDEWPSFGTWTFAHNDGFTVKLYERVFQLLLRLKGNYLWPAMWSSSFPLDGPGLASAELADCYGIVMGTSHHEPCLRASEEWDKERFASDRYGQEWNFVTNREGLLSYWADGLKRSGHLESICTIGMRGERDSSMLGPDASLRENIELLKDIITEQHKLIAKYVNPDPDKVPQMLALYKEVETYYYGDEQSPGLIDWPELDGVTIMLCEDNYGNMRTLPTPQKRNRNGGYGMYYHFDYHGGPISYEWINSTPLQKVWDQMTKAYDFGVHDIWVVNVGDLKPQELPLSYFMELAYDFDSWGSAHPNRTEEFTRRFVAQCFPKSILPANDAEVIVQLLIEYTRLNGYRRPEALHAGIYNPIAFGEADLILMRTGSLMAKAEELLHRISKDLYDTYVELVYFPAASTANLIFMQVYAGMNQHAASNNIMFANGFIEKIEAAIQRDHALREMYHSVAGGKWSGMASSAHIGFVKWNEEGWRYPVICRATPIPGARMCLVAIKKNGILFSGEYTLPTFTDLRVQMYPIVLGNCGDTPYTYTMEVSAPWIRVSKTSGEVKDTLERIELSVDRTLADVEAEKTKSDLLLGSVTIRSSEVGGKRSQTIICRVRYEQFVDPMVPGSTYAITDGFCCAEVSGAICRAAKDSDAQWTLVTAYGKARDSMRVTPADAFFKEPESAPRLTFPVYTKQEGMFRFQLFTAPSNPVYRDVSLRVWVQANDEAPAVLETLPENFTAGDPGNLAWSIGVLDNSRCAELVIHLRQGMNRVHIMAYDAGVVIQKLVLCSTKFVLPQTYFGPIESAKF